MLRYPREFDTGILKAVEVVKDASKLRRYAHAMRRLRWLLLACGAAARTCIGPKESPGASGTNFSCRTADALAFPAGGSDDVPGCAFCAGNEGTTHLLDVARKLRALAAFAKGRMV